MSPRQGCVQAGTDRCAEEQPGEADAKLKLILVGMQTLETGQRELARRLGHRHGSVEALLLGHRAKALDLPPLRPLSGISLLQAGFPVVHVDTLLQPNRFESLPPSPPSPRVHEETAAGYSSPWCSRPRLMS